MTVPSRARVTPFQVPIFEEVNEPLHCLRKGRRALLRPSAPRQTPALRGLAAGKLGLVSSAKGHSQQCFSSFAISSWTGLLSVPQAPGQDGDSNSNSAEKGQKKSNAGHWQWGCSCFILLLTADYESALLALVYQQFTLQKFDKIPQRLTPAELHPCCHDQFVHWLCSRDVSATTYAKGPNDLIQPS